MKPWKEAASLLLVSKVSAKLSQTSNDYSNKVNTSASLNDESDFDILMTKRSGKSSFLASAYVFPGGHVDIADFSPLWWSLFESNGVSRQELLSFSTSITGPRPPIVTECQIIADSLGENFLPPDLGLRITAIRETFEETGVLLVSDASTKLQHDSNRDLTNAISEWRLKVQSNANLFIEMCTELGLCPDIWSLFEWWNWLTPEALGHKRFDTIFYICFLDRKPDIRTDDKEVTLVEWMTTKKMLEEHCQRKAFLAPPQVYELSRLMNFKDYKSLRDFSINREKLGIQRWSPIMTGFKDGVRLSFPGDDTFGKTQEQSVKTMTSLEENRAKSTNLNRIELLAPVCTVYCNIKLPCGHYSPITFPPLSTAIQSRL
ncbi:Nucleoside diphosphate-linked moiety X motif 19-like protein [Leptotrombidium deliense]|uniref:Nucleoside diphosphate-linked moiety X motif 19-like protein n=1 Tax=Leptotrombidium deliense TaxID=299467 RepID=A0A443STE5_9ACAR|nr:Nucleoside diphosphate-linked moiety X motif 19-like protein [Leptotrombidium deliense]